MVIAALATNNSDTVQYSTVQEMATASTYMHTTNVMTAGTGHALSTHIRMGYSLATINCLVIRALTIRKMENPDFSVKLHTNIPVFQTPLLAFSHSDQSHQI